MFNKIISNLYNYILSKTFSIPLLILIVYFFFKPFWENLINEFIIRYVFSFVQSSPLNDLIVSVITLVLILIFLYKISNRTIPSIENFTLLLSFIIIYLYYRLSDAIWNFVPFTFNDSFVYLDSLILLTFLYLLTFVTLVFKTNLNVKKELSYLNDYPLKINEPDLLGRESFANEIATRIDNTITESSFAIGINGKWGVGKTSFLRMIERKLYKENKIIFPFNPWMSRKPKSITSNFFNELKNHLGKYNDDANKKITQYVNQILNNKDSHIRDLFKNIIRQDRDYLDSYFNEINKIIRNLKKQIIIFIDDIDRLSTSEVVEVLRLIRNSASFNNAIFIVAYDKSYLMGAIKKYNPHNTHCFLEKIFQVEYSLPDYEKIILRTMLSEQLKQRLPKESHIKVENFVTTLSASEHPFIDDFIFTIRDITRFVNTLIPIYYQLEGEVDLVDLINIELIKLKYPYIANDLYYNQKLFFTVRKDLNVDQLIIKKSEKEGINYYIEEYMKGENYSKQDIDIIINALELIFGKDRKPKAGEELDIYAKTFPIPRVDSLSIIRPSNYYRYFSLRVFGSDISQKEYLTFRSTSFNENKKTLDKWVNKGLRWQLFRRFEEIKLYNDRVDFENIILSIFYISNIPPKTNDSEELLENNVFITYENKELIHYSVLDLYVKMKEYESIAQDYYDNNVDEYKKFVNRIFTAATLPFNYEDRFLNFLNTDLNIYNFPINKGERLKYCLEYLGKYLDTVDEFDENVWYLFYGCQIRQFKNNNTWLQIPQDARDILIKFIASKSLHSFLNKILRSTSKPNRFFLSDSIPDIFGGNAQFLEFMKGQNQEDEYVKEFMQFLNKLSIGNFQIATDFDFKLIKVQK